MMTTLQIILAAVGILFIVAIVVYNLWQERKYRKEASRMFSSKREDILLGESVASGTVNEAADGQSASLDEMPEARFTPTPERFDEPPTGEEGVPEASQEEEEGTVPTLSIQVEGSMREVEEDEPNILESVSTGLTSPEHAVPPPRPEPEVRVPAPEPAFTPKPEVQTPAAEAGQPAGFQPESQLDEDIEYVARLRFATPSFTAYTALLDNLRRIGKPLRAMGKRETGGWEPLSGNPSTAYTALEFGVLLADRTGALTSEQIDRFCRALYEFAAAHGGAVSCPDKQVALQLARELDMFCMDVDVLIGLNVMARERQPFKGEEIDRVTHEMGLILERDGAYYLKDAQGNALFSVANQEERPFREGGAGLVTHGVTLLFDVPRIKNGLVVFDRMTGLGLRLAEALGGRLVDDNGRNVNQDSLQKDRRRLSDYYSRMQERGIPAGGERALRLFA
jgi:FtsZ-interacting cell division protein ZipA